MSARENDRAGEALAHAVLAEKGLADARSKRARAFLSASVAGWTVREIASAVGVSSSKVWRIIAAASREDSVEEKAGE